MFEKIAQRLRLNRTREGAKENHIHDLSYYKFVIDSLPIAVVALDSELKIIGFNPWAEQVTGYTAKEALGRQCGEILQGGMCGIDCPLKPVIERMKPFVQIETTIQSKQGRTIPVSISTAGLFDKENKLIGAVEAFQDISQLKALEREKSNLISMFAHDMRSSLTGIHGLGLRLLKKSAGMDAEKRNKHLEIITKEAAKLESLVDDFLEFSRLEAGSLKLHFSATSLDKELLEIFQTYRFKALQRGIRLELQVEEILPVIDADADRLRRVFTNLLDNALKFSKEGCTVSITAREADRGVLVRIVDEGIGIDARDLPYIFDSFHRGHGADKREGYGLGLATVKAIVEGHGGRIMVTSELNRGSVFTVFLPKEKRPDESADSL